MYTHDSHIHTEYSHDVSKKGGSTFDLTVRTAIERGLDEITICDHLDIDDILDGIYPELDLDGVASSVNEAREKYGDKIRINFGVELGQPHVRPKESREIIEKYKFDYVLGTLHNLRLCPDFRFFRYELMKQPQLDYIVRRIVDESIEIVDFGVHSLAHLDYIKNKFDNCGVAFDENRYTDDFARLFKRMIETGTAMEINTGHFVTKGFLYPSDGYIGLYRELGGELITFGSDAHAAREVGDGIEGSMAQLRDMGFKSQTVMRDGKLVQIEL